MRYYNMRFKDGKIKALTFSYDDGCYADVKLAKIFDKYNLKATFNINSALVGSDDWHLTKEQIKENIIDKGHEVAIHGAKHKAPGMITLADGICEMLDGRRDLERMFGGIIKGMAYPNTGISVFANNATYQEVKDYLVKLGIAYGRSLGRDNANFEMPTDWHNWIPTAHHDNQNINEWIDKFLQVDVNSMGIPKRRPKLFYLWGHSYEFDRKDNWEHIENICEKLSGKEDIWYATNIEIYNYTMAYHSLEFNLDMTVCHNPTTQDVWFTADGKNYCVKSGETIEI